MQITKQSNILVITDDGPDSEGHKILLEQLKALFNGATIVGFSTKDSTSGRSMSVSTAFSDKPLVDYSKGVGENYIMEGTPMDILYACMVNPENILGTNQRFTHLFTGINFGANVGVDVFHSATVSVAAMGATLFGLPSVALSQELTPEVEKKGNELSSDRYVFNVAESQLSPLLRQMPFLPGVCYNINFPVSPPKGYKTVPYSMSSRWMDLANTDDEGDVDITALKEGFLVTSQLELSMTPFLS